MKLDMVWFWIKLKEKMAFGVMSETCWAFGARHDLYFAPRVSVIFFVCFFLKHHKDLNMFGVDKGKWDKWKVRE